MVSGLQANHNLDQGLFAPWNYTGSVITTSANWLVNLLNILSILTIFDHIIHNKIRADKLWPRELFVLFVVFLPTFSFVSISPKSLISPTIGVFALINVLSAVLRDVVLAPQKYRDENGGYILVRSRLRWLLIAPLQAYTIIVCFAILLLHFGQHFDPKIIDKTTALYQSALTFTTLGYGDIKPVDALSKAIVIIELLFFFLFIGIKLPIAASVVRVKSVTE